MKNRARLDGKIDLTALGFEDLLFYLPRMGCTPALYYRGRGLWRAHINASGNSWHDGRTPLSAFKGAVKLWRRRDYLLDGTADRTYAKTQRLAKANLEEAC